MATSKDADTSAHALLGVGPSEQGLAFLSARPMIAVPYDLFMDSSLKLGFNWLVSSNQLKTLMVVMDVKQHISRTTVLPRTAAIVLTLVAALPDTAPLCQQP
jgi:hypothetical protein